MNQPQRILIVEIKTMDNLDLDPNQVESITVYENSGSYYLALNFKQIRACMIEAIKTIISLGSNYRHPLYFDVQILSGDGMDAGVALSENRDHRRRRRKRKRN